MVKPGAFFEVAYGQLDAGVLTVERVDLDGGAVQVGEKAEVSPVRPQPGLSRSVSRVRRTISRRPP